MNTKDFKTRSETIHRAAPCPANHWVIGLDIGYSAIKGMSPNKIYSVPAYARKIPADRVRLNEPSETDIYYKAENGDIWVVGSLAYNELSASVSKNYLAVKDTILICSVLSLTPVSPLD